MDTAFWNGKRVFLTGHTGFKGSWLALWLQQAGAEVTGFSLVPNTEPNLYDQARINELIHASIIGDIRNLPAVEQAMQACNPEILIHMAAQPIVRTAWANPVDTYSTNIMGTVHILDAARRCDALKAVISVISDKCYENKGWHWAYREDEPMGGKDPYSSSKGAADIVSRAYYTSYFKDLDIPLSVVRAGNVIGGGDWSTDRLIPDILRSILDGNAVQIRNPHATRPWQHVLEALHGYILLTERMCKDGHDFAGAWNFGPSEEDAQPVDFIVNRMVELWGNGAAWELDGGNHPREDRFLKVDASKARAELQWEPKLRLDGALEWIMDWFRASKSGDDMQAATLKQLDAFANL